MTTDNTNNTISKDLVTTLCMFLNYHEISCILGRECLLCANFRHLRLLDKDVNHELIKNFCKEDKNIIDKIPLKKLTSNTQRIHVIGNVWAIINSLNHRRFSFFCKTMTKQITSDSICITDTEKSVPKIDKKMIITQGYSKKYDLTSVDYLLVEKKYIDQTFNIPFDENIIPEKGFLVIDLTSNEKFYTE